MSKICLFCILFVFTLCLFSCDYINKFASVLAVSAHKNFEDNGIKSTERIDSLKCLNLKLRFMHSRNNEDSTIMFGVAASTQLPLGTQFRLPREFGKKIFTVRYKLKHMEKNLLVVYLPRSKFKILMRLNSRNKEGDFVGGIYFLSPEEIEEYRK